MSRERGRHECPRHMAHAQSNVKSVAGRRPQGRMEAHARRGLLFSGCREQHPLHAVREAARGSGDRLRRCHRQIPLGTRDTHDLPEQRRPRHGQRTLLHPLDRWRPIFTTGVAGRLQAIDKTSGKLLWTQQLWTDHKGTRVMYGYASSPIAWRDTVIVPVGGRGKAVMAFKQADGSVAWSRNDFENAYSSPLLINVDGLEIGRAHV